MAIEDITRSEITAVYNSIQTSIDDLFVNFRNKTDDIISTMLDITIEGLCSNNVKNRMYMQRLMRINYSEEESTHNILGANAVRMGNSNVFDEKPNMHVSYAQDINYIDNVINSNGLGYTNIKDTSQTYNNYNGNELYSRTKHLVPDELNQLPYEDVWVINNKRSLLYQTKELFNENKINTLISRFCTGGNGYDSGVTDEHDVVSQYGMSRGRNLLLKSAEERNNGQYPINGYNNPYCRVWTHHYQYDRLDKLIRPFTTLTNEERTSMTIGEPITKKEFHEWSNFSDDNSGYWKSNNKGWDYSVLNDNGFVNIAPKYDPIESKKVHTKQCMFSIENLAWKGYDPYSFEKALSWEQRGPMGGRIMWFPPYGISFNETTQANWNSHTFIGRGEDVYTYTNTTRSGTLSFMMVVDHPSIIDYVSYQYGIEDSIKDTDLLRFFAGCDSSTLKEAAKPTPLTDEYTETSYNTIEEKKELPVEKEEKEIADEINQVTFYVFFPNNYSGVYDHTGSNVEAIAYLLNGINSQKKTGDLYDEDVSIKFDTLYDFDGIGYEMSSIGITETSSDETGCIFGTKSTWSSIMNKNIKNYPINKEKKWWYRIDGEYKIPKSNGDMYKNTYDQTLKSKNNYEDNSGYSLNSDADAVKEAFDDVDNNEIYSLREVAAALSNNEKVRNFLSGADDDERIDKLVELFNNKDTRVTKINGIGFSNSHGNNSSISINKTRNETLATERVNTVIDWIKYINNGKYKNVASDVNITTTSSKDNQPIKTSDVSSIEAKKYRSAKITIEFTTDKKTTVSDSDTTTTNENNTTVTEGKQEYIGYTAYNDTYGREYYKDKNGNVWVKVENEDDPHYGEVVMGKFLQDGHVVGLNEISNERYGLVKDANGNIIGFNGERNKIRYDQEYHFFKVLKQADPIVFDKLMDKIRYFDPAFHSMTPEGFNARLTFLQQCTRQGNTISSSDVNNGTSTDSMASNLAFGRPPFCVLRLGDFYNQMIVIDNISINFDPLVWDLNIEGIGVQPLLANITISFKFIGGGDMTGPIKRLQNAMTFNYYANARLYDNRADRIVYKSNTNNKEQGAIGNDEVDYNKSDFYITQNYKKK